MSLRDKILQAKDITSEKMKVPEWGVTIEIRSMNGTQRAKLMRDAYDPNTEQVDWDYASLVIAAAYDPKTEEPIFSQEDHSALNEKHGGVLERIAMVVLRLSGLVGDALDEAKKN
jgi:hypothetical protein